MKIRLKEIRESSNLSQGSLAELAGISRNSIGSIERGEFEPTAYVAGMLCKALDVKFEDMFIFEKEGE